MCCRTLAWTPCQVLRTFRVFRLIKRIPAVRRIVTALFRALPAMVNALTIVFVLMSVYAVLAVRFFRDDKTQGAEYFGTFFDCLFTLWQVTSGDDWSVIVRELMANQPSSTGAILVACFFTSYMLLIALCLINVVVCVLVDRSSRMQLATRPPPPPRLLAVCPSRAST